MPRMVWSSLVCLGAVASVAPLHADGQPAANGVTVTASGEVKAKPTAVEIDVTVAESDARAGDALTKYDEAKKRLIEACGELKMATLAIEERAVEVTAEPGQADAFGGVVAPAAFGFQPAVVVAPQGFANVPPPKGPEIRFGRTIRLTLKGIRDKPEAEVLTTIGTILDAVRDAGGRVGPVAGDPQASFGFRKATCRFVLDDLPELRKKATEAALAQARADAGVLSGGRVGPLVSISSADSAANLGPRVDTTVQAPLDTDRFTDIPVRVTVQATFRLE